MAITKPKQRTMPFEKTAYAKMGQAITLKQRRRWNALRHEMWSLSEALRDETIYSVRNEKAERLHALISQLPIFHEDGKGCSRSGPLIENF